MKWLTAHKMKETIDIYKKAKQERKDGNSIRAGELYTSVAFSKASNLPFYPNSGGELKQFLEAATCYRIGGQMDRCQNRCEIGILWAKDLRDRALSGSMPEHDIHYADRGGWDEAIGMFRLVGDLDGVDEAYNRAFEIFESAGDPLSHRAEKPKTTLYTWFTSLELAATNETYGMTFRQQRTYTEFANYVREKIPEYLNVLEQRGRWGPFPDGENE